MEHANAIYQFLVPCLIALNIWMLRQGVAAAKGLFRRNEEEHRKLEELCSRHDRRLTRLEIRVNPRESGEDSRE